MTVATDETVKEPESMPLGHAPGAALRQDRRYVLGLMTVIYTVNYIDRSVINVLAQPIKKDLGLTDAGLGMVGGVAFALLYATMGLPFARLAERRSRVNLISVALIAWSAMTAVCGLATSFWQLFLARLGVGVGEAGCNPVAQSMISDIYPPERRSTALAVYSLGIPIGTLLGAFLGGWIGQMLGWRFAFAFLGLPGVIIALLVRKTVREPVRGGQDRHVESSARAPSLRTACLKLWELRTIRHVVAGFTICGTAYYALTTFVVAYVLRAFDVSLLQVSLAFGLISGSAGFVGLLFGGLVTDWLGQRDKRIYGWVPAAAHLLATPLFILALSQRNPGLLMLGFIPPATLCLMYVGPGFAMVHNLVPPRTRATAVAALIMISGLLGMCLGPPLVGAISDIVAHRSYAGSFEAVCRTGSSMGLGCRAAEAAGLRVAMMSISTLYVWSALHFMLAGANYRSDLESMK